MTTYQPYYQAYARAHGKTCEEMIEKDRVDWPGKCMTGFILWISVEERKFHEAHPEAFMFGNIADWEAWGRWVTNR